MIQGGNEAERKAETGTADFLEVKCEMLYILTYCRFNKGTSISAPHHHVLSSELEGAILCVHNIKTNRKWGTTSAFLLIFHVE